MEKLLNEFVERSKKAYGERLVSVVLYGSAAVGDHSGRYSDINIFCALTRVTPRELADAEPIFNWWCKKENPSPLLMSVDEVRTSTDCFPIEFHDIRERHRVLYGEDLVASLDIDDSFYRAQVEYQLRAKVLRLRQKGAAVMHDRGLLLRLLADSVSTFCVLSRHALRLHDKDAGFEKRQIVEQAHEAFGIDRAPFLSLLDLRDERIKPKTLQPASIYEQYLKEIQKVVDAVDKLAK
jgi:predicted nucleotidyltransferase